jgi:hypothetical protein
MSPLLLLAAVSCVPFGALAAVMGMAWLEDRMVGRGARVTPVKHKRALRAAKPTAERKSSGHIAASA